MRRYAAYVIILIAVEVFIALVIADVRKDRINRYVESQTELDRQNLHSTINALRSSVTEVYDRQVDTPKVRELVLTAYKDKSGRDAYRDELYKEMLPVFRVLRSVNVTEVQFHFPDTSSFLRMSRPKAFGDLLTKRNMVWSSNEKNIEAEGFEAGRFIIGYRYIFTLNTDTAHAGTVEFVISSESLVDAMNKLYGSNFKYIVPKSIYKRPFSVSMGMISDKYIIDSCDACSLSEQNMSLSYYINQVIKRDFDKEVGHRLETNSVSSYITSYNHKNYIITFLPVRDRFGGNLGAIVSFHPAEMYDRIVGFFGLLFVLVAFLAAVVILSIFVLDMARRRARDASVRLEKMVEDKVDELRDKEQFFAQQAKMVTMGEMLTAILHQWKQPISSISLIADMLKFECETSECSPEIKRYIDNIKEQTAFMTQTGRDFSSFLKPSATPVVFNVCDAVQDVIRLFDFSFAKYNTSFSVFWTDRDRALAFIRGYPNEFKHVLLNLFNNARDAIASHRDRMIDNGQDVSGFKGLINISVETGDRSVIIKVSDTGGGIADEAIGHIFRQYFSTKQEKGSGIGLYMTKNLVESNMNGSISVRNVKDGAEFTIICPMQDRED